MRDVLRERNFALLWVGQLVSTLGDVLLVIALPVYVYERTGSAMATGLAAISATLPALLLGSVAGVFVDRWDRKRTMVAADLLRALVLPLLLLAGPLDRMWVAYLVLVAVSAVTQFFDPARNSLVPRLVRGERLISANSLIHLGDTVSGLVGPAAGGMLLAASGLMGIVIIDSVSFLLSALLLGLISVPADGRGRGGARLESEGASGSGAGLARFRREWLEGLRLVVREPVLAVLFAATATAMLGQGVISVLWVVHLHEVLRGGAAEYGWVQTATAVGALTGGIALGRFGGRVPPRTTIVLSGALSGLLLLAIFLLASVPVALVLSVPVGMASVGFFVTTRTLLQGSADDRLRGRMFGALGATSALMLLVGMAVSSALGDVVGSLPLLSVAAALYSLAGLGALILPRWEVRSGLLANATDG